jgi:hypothetical protein
MLNYLQNKGIPPHEHGFVSEVIERRRKEHQRKTLTQSRIETAHGFGVPNPIDDPHISPLGTAGKDKEKQPACQVPLFWEREEASSQGALG